MDGRTAHAFFGQRRPARVAGRTLHRLTLRHCAGLCLSENPAALGGRDTPVSFGHVLAAADLCATSGESQWRASVFGDGRWRRVKGYLAGLRWGRTWLREWAAFDEWLAAEVGCLPRFLKTRGGKLPGSDWVILLWAAMVRSGIPGETAWETPLGTAAWLRVAWRELDGHEVPLLTEDLEEEMLELGWSKDDL